MHIFHPLVHSSALVLPSGPFVGSPHLISSASTWLSSPRLSSPWLFSLPLSLALLSSAHFSSAHLTSPHIIFPWLSSSPLPVSFCVFLSHRLVTPRLGIPYLLVFSASSPRLFLAFSSSSCLLSSSPPRLLSSSYPRILFCLISSPWLFGSSFLFISPRLFSSLLGSFQLSSVLSLRRKC